jgi:hypothetical protein
MLIVDIYGLVPAFTLLSFLLILLWPENIAFKNRLLLFMAVLIIWILASFLGLEGYSSSDNQTVCFINLLVGVIGLIALLATYRVKPSREE